jgi:hypothetical protein
LSDDFTTRFYPSVTARTQYAGVVAPMSRRASGRYIEFRRPRCDQPLRAAVLSRRRFREDQAKLTFGASRSAAVPTSKKSRLAKANMPATTFDGNI